METLSGPFLAAIGATATQPLMMVEIGFSSPLRIATRDVSWNGYSWLADRVLKVEGLSADGAGKLAATITIGNHDDLLGALLLNQRIADRPVNVWEAWIDDASAMYVRQRLAGIGGRATCGAEVAVIEAGGGNAMAHAPRLLVRHLVGWPPPKPDGYAIQWNGQTYEFEGRQ